MSTRFAARKIETEGQEQREAVNWLYTADLGTMALSISERSGLVKVDLGLARRNPALYRNEILAFLDKADEIRRYLEDHADAKDAPPTKAQQRAMDSLTKTVLVAKEKESYRQALADAGIDATQIDIMTVKKFGSV